MGLSSSEKAALIVAFIVIALILGLLVAMLSRVVKRIDAVEEDLKTLTKRLTDHNVFDEKE